jgi:hypothetical protein
MNKQQMLNNLENILDLGVSNKGAYGFIRRNLERAFRRTIETNGLSLTDFASSKVMTYLEQKEQRVLAKLVFNSDPKTVYKRFYDALDMLETVQTKAGPVTQYKKESSKLAAGLKSAFIMYWLSSNDVDNVKSAIESLPTAEELRKREARVAQYRRNR